MVLCPRCGSPRLMYHVDFDAAAGEVTEFHWSCQHCAWVGKFPNRVRGSLLLHAPTPTKRVTRFTRAMKSLMRSGDLILVIQSDGTKEVVL